MPRVPSGHAVVVIGALAVLAALGGAARAGCPTPRSGQALPVDAQPAIPDSSLWRDDAARLDRVLAETDLARVRVLFLGDSITAAWDRAAFERHFGQMGALRLGVRGDTTQGLLGRLAGMRLGDALRPALIVVLIGTNNTRAGGAPEPTAIGIGAIVTRLRQLSPASRILLLGILPRGPDRDDPKRRLAVQINRQVTGCADGIHVFYADPGQALLDPAGTLSTKVAADLLHPTPLGYDILATRLADAVARALAPARP